jgi:flagellar motor protein MotB
MTVGNNLEKKIQDIKGDATVVQFLSLYLIILAFFILLVSISTVSQEKSDAVLDSITKKELKKKKPKAGKVFQDKTAVLFADALGVEKTEILQVGKIMRIVMAADALFEVNTAIIKTEQRPLIDRLIAALSNRPKGTQFDMEFVIGSAYSSGSRLPVKPNLAMSRAGAFAREILSRGAPPDAISIGMAPVENGQIVMWFYVRSPDDAKKFYSRLIIPPEDQSKNG